MTYGHTSRHAVPFRLSRLPMLFPLVATGLVATVLVTPLPAAATGSAAGPVPTRGASTLTAPAASPAGRPVAPSVRQVAVRGVSTRGLDALGTDRSSPTTNRRSLSEADDLIALSAPERVDGFAVVGVTWAPEAIPSDASLAVRSQVEGDWSAWQPLNVDEDHAPDANSAEAAAARPGSDPLVVGDVDAVQLRVASGDSAHHRRDATDPTRLRLAIVDPGTSAADAATKVPAYQAAGQTGISRRTSRAARPKIYSRAQWGADESLRSGSPTYGEVRAAFVHHTVNANGYSRADVPSILRGIYAYHTRGRGWSDVGYNFLVDRFGRIWEGRYGGVDRPVVGAHTYGYNDDAFAMSAIGNFEEARPSGRMLNAYGRLFAWKLGLHGIRPRSRQVLDGDVFKAVNGHRDAASTACPGTYLYAKLAVIRKKASRAKVVTRPPAVVPDVGHDLVGSPWPDLLVRRASTGTVSVLPGDGGPRFRRRQVALKSFGHVDLMTGLGDVTGDGNADLLARDADSRRAYVYPGDGAGGFDSPRAGTAKFARVNLLQGGTDLNGDRRRDVVGRRQGGALVLYPGRGGGRFGPAQVLVHDASAYNRVVGAGDLDRDGKPDLVARNRRGQVVLLSNPTRPTSTQRVIAHGWGKRTLIGAGKDLTGDRRPDIVARDERSGRTWIHVANAKGRLIHRLGGWSTWERLDQITVLGDGVGDRNVDVAARTQRGRLVLFPGTGSRWLQRPVGGARRLAGVDTVLVVGDWNGDGHGDAMTRRRSTGRLRLHLGDGTGKLGKPVASWPGWDTRRALVAPGDVNGDGRPDVIAQDADGDVYLYPNNGAGGMGSRRLLRGNMLRPDLVAAARANEGGSPGIFVRERLTKALWLYRVDGTGGLLDPVRVRRDFSAYDAVAGAGDLDGDGRPDLLARQAQSKKLFLFRGTRKGGLARRTYAAPSMAAYDLLA